MRAHLMTAARNGLHAFRETSGGRPIDEESAAGFVLGKQVEVHAEGDLPARATADLFPAYDDDGGLLVILTPAK